VVECAGLQQVGELYDRIVVGNMRELLGAVSDMLHMDFGLRQHLLDKDQVGHIEGLS
jgi:hypothetical protein